VDSKAEYSALSSTRSQKKTKTNNAYYILWLCLSVQWLSLSKSETRNVTIIIRQSRALAF